MSKGQKTILFQKVGRRTVYLVPEEDSVDIYYQKKGYAMMFAWGEPITDDLDDLEPDHLFALAWGNFEFYEKEMFT